MVSFPPEQVGEPNSVLPGLLLGPQARPRGVECALPRLTALVGYLVLTVGCLLPVDRLESNSSVAGDADVEPSTPGVTDTDAPGASVPSATGTTTSMPICRTGPPGYIGTIPQGTVSLTAHGGIAARNGALYVTVWDIGHLAKIQLADHALAGESPVRLWGSTGGIFGIDVSADGDTFWVADSRGGVIRAYNGAAALINSRSAGTWPKTVVLHDTTLFVTGRDDSLVRLFDAATLALTGSFELPFGGATKDLAIADGKVYAVSSDLADGFLTMGLDGSDQVFVSVPSLGSSVSAIAVHDGAVYLVGWTVVVVTSLGGETLCAWSIEPMPGSEPCEYADVAVAGEHLYLPSACQADVAHVVVY